MMHSHERSSAPTESRNRSTSTGSTDDGLRSAHTAHSIRAQQVSGQRRRLASEQDGDRGSTPGDPSAETLR
jgi:hypothetical protein